MGRIDSRTQKRMASKIKGPVGRLPAPMGHLLEPINVRKDDNLESLHNQNESDRASGSDVRVPEASNFMQVLDNKGKHIGNDNDFTITDPRYVVTGDPYDSHIAALDGAPVESKTFISGKFMGDARGIDQDRRVKFDTPNVGERSNPNIPSSVDGTVHGTDIDTAQGGLYRGGMDTHVIAKLNREQHGIKYTGSKTDRGRFSKLDPQSGALGGVYQKQTHSKPSYSLRKAINVSSDCLDSVTFAGGQVMYKPSNKPGC
jgi:hypothetical protein